MSNRTKRKSFDKSNFNSEGHILGNDSSKIVENSINKSGGAIKSSSQHHNGQKKLEGKPRRPCSSEDLIGSRDKKSLFKSAGARTAQGDRSSSKLNQDVSSGRCDSAGNLPLHRTPNSSAENLSESKYSTGKQYKQKTKSGSSSNLTSQSVSGTENQALMQNGGPKLPLDIPKHRVFEHSEKSSNSCDDRVRKIVQQEGRSARNLIAYNVPAVDDFLQRQGLLKIASSPKSPRKKSAVGRDNSPSVKKTDDNSSVRSSGSRPASSVGSCIARKTDVRARYWAFLFDNLKRAVDEIYQTCETDESIDECKEVILILQQCTKDFQSLINQWDVIKTYENMEVSGQRPVSLAWEVRKTSPGKLHLKEANTPNSIQLASPLTSKRSDADTSDSWANRVKGAIHASDLEAELLKNSCTDEPPQPSVEEVNPTTEPCTSDLISVDDTDQEGWETVRRSRSKTSPPAKVPAISKNSTSLNNKRKLENFNEKGEQRSYPNQPNSDQLLGSNQRKTKDNNEIPPPIKSNSYRDAVMKSKAGLRPQQNISSNKIETPEGSSTKAPKTLTPRRLDMDSVYVPESKSIERENLPSLQSDGSKDKTSPVSDSTCNPISGSASDPISDPVAHHSQITELKLDLSSAMMDSDDNEQYLEMELEEVLNGALNDEALNEKDAAIQCAIQEEQSYLLEIEQYEKEEMPQDLVEEEADDPELSASGHLDSMNGSASALDWDTLLARYEAEADRRKILGLTWADIDEAESRTPGRGAHMHEKLSSPSRKRSIMESKRIHEEKQAKAAELREKYRREKAEKIKYLSKKVEEVRGVKEELQSQKRDYLHKKLQEAEEKRQQQLMLIVKKAHEEENKANEIAFINTLSEQNKKMDIMTKHQDVEARLLDMQEERQRKIGEKAAKDAAVEERRKALIAERSARLAEMLQKRKRREEEIEQKNFERDKERAEACKAKEREHKDRLAQIERQQLASIEELQKKIEKKQTDSTRRHNEQLQNKREKAFIMSIINHSTEDHGEAPKLEPYDTIKMCNVCNMTIPSEVHLKSHLRGQQHQNMLKERLKQTGSTLSKNEIETFNIEHITDVPGDFVDPKLVSSRERSRALRKRCKKLKQRMQARGNEFEAGLDLRQENIDSPNKAKLCKIVKDVMKFIQGQEKGPWPQNKISALDRSIGEASRILDKKNSKDQLAFKFCGGLGAFIKLLQLLNEESTRATYPKTCSAACQVLRLACKLCYENCHYILFSNKIGALVDVLTTRLTCMAPEEDLADSSSVVLGSTIDSLTFSNCKNQEKSEIDVDACVTGILHTLAVIFSCLTQVKVTEKQARPGFDAFTNRINDVVSYIITAGIVDRLQIVYSKVRGTLDSNTILFSFLQHSISFLNHMTKLSSKRQNSVFDTQQTDCTSLMQTYEDIELAGIMSLLYNILLHNVPIRGEVSVPPELPESTLTVTLVAFKLINQISTMDYKLVQRVLGTEGVSLELRHIVSYLIWYCGHHKKNEELLHEVILCVGYFAVLNLDNQAIMQSGQSPTILQQLCSLPFQYFSDPRLVTILYPTLIACCFKSPDNKAVLELELSCDLLSNYLEEFLLEAQQQKTPRKPVGVSIVQDGRMALPLRFPQEHWAEAKLFFAVKC